MVGGIFFRNISKKDLTKESFRAAILLTIVSKMALVVEVCAGTSNYKEDYHETRSCKAST